MTVDKKESTQSDLDFEDDDFPVPPTPPDGGWGWLVLLASLLTSFVVDGVCYSFFVFFVDLKEAFHGANTSALALVGSLIPGLYLSLGPVAGALANKFGCRLVTMAGTVIAAIGFGLSIFSQNVTHLIITYGILGGLGFGLMYLPSIVIVNFYFEKMRALATGIAVCGSGIGTFAFAPLARFILNKYGWRGGNLIVAGIVLNGLVLGAIFRPLVAERPRKRRKKDLEMENMKPMKSIIMQKIALDKERQRTISTGSLDGAIITTADELITDKEELAKVKERLLNSAHADLMKTQCDSLHNIPDITVSEHDDLQTNGSAKGGHGDTVSMGENEYSERTGAVRFSPANPRVELIKKDELTIPIYPRKRTTSNISAKSSESFRKSTDSLRKEVSRPMYRADIFYSGSVRSLAEFKSSEDMQSYIKSTTSLPPGVIGGNCCAPFSAAMGKLFDFSVLRSPTFIIVLTSYFLAMLGFFTPFVYMPPFVLEKGARSDHAVILISIIGYYTAYVYMPMYAMDRGMGQEKSVLLVSILGISNVVGRILSGFISDRPWADVVIINNWSLIIGGALTCCFPWLPSFPYWATYSALYGLCIAAHISLRSIMCVELLGLEKLTSSFGIMLLVQGIGSLVATPILGAVKDATGDYTYPFIISGCVLSLAGIISLPIRRISRWERRNEARHESYTQISQRPVPPVPDDV